MCLAAVVLDPAAGALERFVELDPFDAGRAVCRRFEDVDGLPQNTIHAILVDREGLLWAGTQDGAAWYDGHAWNRLELPNGARSNFVRSMIETSNGDLWIGSQAGGLARRRAGEWTVFEPGDSGLPDDRVNVLLEAPRADGGYDLWIGTHGGGVARYDGEAWAIFGAAAGLPSPQIWDLLMTEESDGPRLWIGTGSGLASLHLGSGRIEVPQGAPKISVSSLLVTTEADGEQRLWAGTYGGGLWWKEGDAWRSAGLGDGLPNLFLTDLARSPSGGSAAFWIASDGGGLARRIDGVIRPLELGADLSSGAVYKVLETTAEQGARAVWIGTRNNGLLRVVEGLWRSFQPFPETPNVPVNAILLHRRPDGRRALWIGTDGFGLAVREDEQWRRIGKQEGGFGSDTVMALAETRSVGGRPLVWVGTRHGGLSVLDGGRWRHYHEASGELPNDMVQALAEESDPANPANNGTLWVGTRTGLASFDGRRWHRDDEGDGAAQNSVLSLLTSRDPQGRRELWIGSTEGLALRKGTERRRWSIQTGLPNASVQALYLRRTAAGRRELWVGTDGGGIVLLDPDRLAESPVALHDAGYPELPNGSVYAILEDETGRVYVLTNRGVSRYSPSPDGESAYRLEQFTTQHGLPLNQGNRGTALRDDEGRLWFGTVGGAAAFDPRAELVDRRPKRLRLEAEALDCASCEIFDGALLDHDQNRLRFRFALLSYFGEPLTRYRTFLDGHEQSPSDWGAATERELGLLPAGHYLFRVWGRDFAGNLAGPAEIAFSIRPAPWQTRSARLLAVLLLVALVLALLRARSRRHQRRERELEELVDAKTRRLQRANAQLVELSFVDALTSVPNRRRFDELLEKEWKRSLRAGSSVGLILIDIDSFKAYNDAYGHLQGDECLRQVASAMADGLVRSGDVIARYGGEEFAVILPATEASGAMQVAELLRRRVEALALPHARARGLGVLTVSCGAAAIVPALETDPAELIRRADEALYRAKRSGGNESAVQL
ncbi:MAG: diguanylate cyclase [Thermoanaerobaculia bacterium]